MTLRARERCASRRRRAAETAARIGLAALLWLVAGPALGARITDVRVGLHPGYARVVLQTDAAAPYERIELPDAADGEIAVRIGATSRAREVPARGAAPAVVLEPLPDGATLARIRSRGPVRVEEQVLSRPPRVVLDLRPDPASRAADRPAPEPAGTADAPTALEEPADTLASAERAPDPLAGEPAGDAPEPPTGEPQAPATEATAPLGTAGREPPTADAPSDAAPQVTEAPLESPTPVVSDDDSIAGETLPAAETLENFAEGARAPVAPGPPDAAEQAIAVLPEPAPLPVAPPSQAVPPAPSADAGASAPPAVSSPPPLLAALEPRSLGLGAALGAGAVILLFGLVSAGRRPGGAESTPPAAAVRAAADPAHPVESPASRPPSAAAEGEPRPPDTAAREPETLGRELLRMHHNLDERLAEVSAALAALGERQQRLETRGGAQREELVSQRVALARLQRTLTPPARRGRAADAAPSGTAGSPEGSRGPRQVS